MTLFTAFRTNHVLISLSSKCTNKDHNMISNDCKRFANYHILKTHLFYLIIVLIVLLYIKAKLNEKPEHVYSQNISFLFTNLFI